MAEVSQLAITEIRARELPRSPASISPVSSRRGSPRSIKEDKDFLTPTPSSPPIRLTRKQAASLNTEAANNGVEEILLSSTGPNNSRITTREQVCLCQPDPKIPRPRNAFILYRQHYQAQVVGQNPGLANPEISKIIGEQWRDQPIEVKNDWKRLAEEEKQRHQRQYPDYRYQPRRAGKPNGRSVSSSTSDDPTRCPKCNGRYISTPSTPLTPFTPSAVRGTERLLPPFISGPSRDVESSHTRFPTPEMIPHTVQPHHHIYRKQQISGPNSEGLGPQLGSLREREEELEMIQSPRLKRQRQSEGPSNSYPSPSWNAQSQRLGRFPMSAIGYSDDQRPLPGPNTLVYHSGQGVMEPPPRPAPVTSHFPVQHTNTFDESLRLPPLQTQLQGSGSGHGSARGTIYYPPHHHLRDESQARSVEAMVMTIPYINKIKVLSKISPPLATPGPTSPVQETRGAVIAIEGAESKIVGEVGKYIEEYLSKDQECMVQIWQSDTSPLVTSDSKVDTEIDAIGGMSPTVNHNELEHRNLFVKYLDEIHAWHHKSSEMALFITTAPATSNQVSPKPVSPLSTASSTSITSNNVRQRCQIPVALLPSGFSLTIADAYASSIPINDAYAPVDHWQWMATLWRGIIGPDLTVYVKVMGSSLEDREEINRYGGVEVRGDCGGIIVRVEAVVEEKTLRRLGFEVLECVRAIAGGDKGGIGRFRN